MEAWQNVSGRDVLAAAPIDFSVRILWCPPWLHTFTSTGFLSRRVCPLLRPCLSVYQDFRFESAGESVARANAGVPATSRDKVKPLEMFVNNLRGVLHLISV